MMKTLRYFFMSMLMFVSGSAMAQDATIVFDASVDKGNCTSSAPGADQITKDGVTIAVTKGAMNLTDQYRCYKNETFTVTSTAGNITKVEINCTAEGDAQYGPGCFTGATAGAYAFEGKVGTWTGTATTFSLTASSNQVRITKVIVTLGEGGEVTPVEPQPEPTVEEITVAKALEIAGALESGKTTDAEYIVNGFIIADPEWKPYYKDKNDPNSEILNYNLNVTIADDAAAAEGLLVYNVYDLTGTYFATQDADVAKGVKVQIQGKLQNYKGTTLELVKGHFLAIGDKTGIKNVQNNQFQQNGVMYNVAGQVVNNGYKGLVIMNGRKFVNK